MNRIFFSIVFLYLFKAEAQTSAFQLADSLFAMGNYQKAIELYQKSTPKISAATYQKIAQAYQATGNLSLAIRNYEEAIQQNQELVVAKSRLAKLYYQNSKYQLSDSLFRELIQHYPENPDFYYRLALVKEKLKDTTAIQDFKKVLEIDEHHQKALYELAKVHYEKKNHVEVENLGEKALSSYPENTGILSLLAQNALAQRNYYLAKSRFEQLLQLNKKSVFIHLNLGYCYFNLKEYEKAAQQFKEVIQLENNHQLAGLFAGKSLLMLERYQEAESFLRVAVVLADQPLDDYYTSFALSLQKQKKFKQAIDNFKIALEESPKNYRAPYELAVCVDNYYKDVQAKINYYQLFINKFKKEHKAKYYLFLAKERLSDLKEQQHLAKK